MRVTTLTASDLVAYRDLMLEAYEQAADAFTSTAEERRAEPECWWAKRIGSSEGTSTSFGAWQGSDLVGTVALEYSVKPKTRHSALLIGMYVKPGHRREMVGRTLLNSAIEAALARQHIQVLALTLTEGNEPALSLYRSVGFVAWGVEPMAIRTESGLKGKIHMSLKLPRPNAEA
jgi:GNAT superfamily N-acetyltransferase